MSLPTGQQRVLERIEGRLAESDPRLVSLFTIFTRLTRAERMPWFVLVSASGKILWKHDGWLTVPALEAAAHKA